MNYLLKYGLDEEDITELLEENVKEIVMSYTDGMIKSVVEVLLKYKIDFIRDLIMADIGIFAYSPDYVESKIIKMIEKLGQNYLQIINDDISIVIDAIYNN